MANLTVWKFDDPATAEQVRDKVVALQSKQLLQVHDAVVVTWPTDAKRPETKQEYSTTGAGGVGGAFWGLLFGILFMVPLFGVAFGAAAGAAVGSLRDFGIDDDFVETVRAQVTPGTSALFLLASGTDRERVKEELGDLDAELISTNLSVDDEAELRALFAD